LFVFEIMVISFFCKRSSRKPRNIFHSKSFINHLNGLVNETFLTRLSSGSKNKL
jgi:hypothetical protein